MRGRRAPWATRPLPACVAVRAALQQQQQQQQQRDAEPTDIVNWLAQARAKIVWMRSEWRELRAQERSTKAHVAQLQRRLQEADVEGARLRENEQRLRESMEAAAKSALEQQMETRTTECLRRSLDALEMRQQLEDQQRQLEAQREQQRVAEPVRPLPGGRIWRFVTRPTCAFQYHCLSWTD